MVLWENISAVREPNTSKPVGCAVLVAKHLLYEVRVPKASTTKVDQMFAADWPVKQQMLYDLMAECISRLPLRNRFLK